MPLGLFFFILKGAAPCQRRGSGVWPPCGQTEELKTCLREYRHPQLMGAIECRRSHSIKLADIHLEIFVESVGIRNLPKFWTYDFIYGSTWAARPNATNISTLGLSTRTHACISEGFKSVSFVVFEFSNSCIIIYCCLFTSIGVTRRKNPPKQALKV